MYIDLYPCKRLIKLKESPLKTETQKWLTGLFQDPMVKILAKKTIPIIWASESCSTGLVGFTTLVARYRKNNIKKIKIKMGSPLFLIVSDIVFYGVLIE